MNGLEVIYETFIDNSLKEFMFDGSMYLETNDTEKGLKVFRLKQKWQ